MNRLHISIAALLITGASACTLPAEPAQQQKSIAGSCIQASRIQKQEVISNQEIQFTLAGGEVWNNRLTRACPGLKAQGGFSWDASNRICSGLQTIYVLDSGIPCQLGEFTRAAAPGAAS
ncbi:MAG: hypothetical protein RIR41_847 [Pseudomonadota bacterium]|jgi:hypothetical protein